MAKTKPLSQMTDEELAAERIELDQQIAVLRGKKKAIQDEVDRRMGGAQAGHSISNAGGIESQEEVGNG